MIPLPKAHYVVLGIFIASFVQYVIWNIDDTPQVSPVVDKPKSWHEELVALAIESRDDRHCSPLQQPFMQDCIDIVNDHKNLDQAIESRNLKACEEIDNRSLSSYCSNEIQTVLAINQRDATLCDRIVFPEHRRVCISMVEVLLRQDAGEKDVCSLLPEDLKAFCTRLLEG